MLLFLVSMRFQEYFFASGHPNITCTHKTTIMVTTEDFLTLRGDCIAAISSEKGLNDLCYPLKKAIQNDDSRVAFSLNVGDSSFTARGRGDKKISMKHPTDIVIRKSSYVCDRTLMVEADKAACDIEPSIISQLRDGDGHILITVSVEL